MNCSFRFSNSFVRFKDSFAESFKRGGRSILSSFRLLSLRAMILRNPVLIIHILARIALPAYKVIGTLVRCEAAIRPISELIIKSCGEFCHTIESRSAKALLESFPERQQTLIHGRA